MKILFNSKQNASALPVLVALLTTLFFNPAAAKAQGNYTASGTGQTLHTGGSEMADIVGRLEYSGLLLLLSAIVLMGLVWICYVVKECAQLDKPQKNGRKHFIGLWVLVAGVSVFCGSCTVEQRATAAQYRAAEAAEMRNCPSAHHYENHVNSAVNNRYPYNGYRNNGYSNGQGPAFCKYCGHRIFNGPR